MGKLIYIGAVLAAIVLIILIAINFNNQEITKMQLKSNAFENNGIIPGKYTADGENVNPNLEINNAPENAQSLVLIIDDPDAPAGDWVHWILFNIPADTALIEEDKIPYGAVQGMNDFENNNYGGPSPPRGTHRYFFKLYALDSNLDLQEGATKQEVEDAMQGHIIGKAQLIGLYSRS